MRMAVRMLTQTVTYSDEPALSAEPELSDIRAVSGVGGGSIYGYSKCVRERVREGVQYPSNIRETYRSVCNIIGFCLNFNLWHL